MCREDEDIFGKNWQNKQSWTQSVHIYFFVGAIPPRLPLNLEKIGKIGKGAIEL